MKKIILLIGLLIILSFSVNGVNLNENLITYYDFNVDNTNLEDMVGNNNGTVYGATYTENGKYNGGYSFDGINDYIDIVSIIPDIEANTQGTIAFWINATTTGDNDCVFSVAKNLDTDSRSRFEFASNKFQVFIEGSNDDLDVIFLSDNTISTGVWSHIVITQDSTTMKMYVNGNLQTSTSGPQWWGGLPNLNRAKLGERAYSTGLNYEGIIDEFMIWDRNLNQTEITSLYTYGISLNFSISTNLNDYTVYIDSVPYTSNDYIFISHIYKNDTSTYDIILEADGYDNITYNNYDVSSNIITLFSNDINISITSKIFNETITNFNITNDFGSYYDSGLGFIILPAIFGPQYWDFISFDGYNNISDFLVNVSDFENSIYSQIAYNHTFDIKVKNILTDEFINDFNITLSPYFYSNPDFIETETTTNGTIYFNVLESVDYSVTISGDTIATTTFNATTNQTEYIYYVYDYNSLDIFVYDETSLNLINNTNVTLYYTGEDFITHIVTNETGNIYLYNLSSGEYTLMLNAPEYENRYYYLNLIAGSYNSLNAYLINETDSGLKNIFVLCSGSARSSETVSVYNIVNGSLVSIAQRKTDGTGLAPFYLNPDVTYTFIISDSEYGTYTESITPSTSTISFDICAGSSTQPYNWSTVYDKFSYLVYPESPLVLYGETMAFNITVSSPGGFLEGFGITYNDTLYNSLLSSPAGGNVNINIPINMSLPYFKIYYWLNITGENQTYTFSKTYVIQNFTTPGNFSIVGISEEYGEMFSIPWLYIISTVIAGLVMALLRGTHIHPSLNALGGLGVMSVFVYLGFVSVYYLIPVGAVLIIYIMGERD